MNPIELGKFLANLRNEKNLTQEELADKLFIDKRKVSRWECGTSIPEFDILVKLSNILDVSLYELSICKRLDKERISKKTINSFKNIKDLKKYKFKKILKFSIIILLIITSIITLTYTIRNQGSVIVYELKSQDDNYRIDGYYIKFGDNDLLTINSIGDNINNNYLTKKDCVYDILNNKHLMVNIYKNNKVTSPNKQQIRKGNVVNNINTTDRYIINAKCQNTTNKELDDVSFEFKFQKMYSNSLFDFN